jgi:hypothetical protein
MLNKSMQHDVTKLTSTGNILGYYNLSAGYNIAKENWQINNPVQSIGYYSFLMAWASSSRNADDFWTNALINNKYDIATSALFMERHPTNHSMIVALGDFILKNIDIDKVVASNYLKAPIIKNNLEVVLYYTIRSARALGAHETLEKARQLRETYF